MLEMYYREKIKLIDSKLSDILTTSNQPELIYEAMRYSIFAGGKRLRPLMLMAASEAVGVEGEKFVYVACGLEMIHTYSLIHDDLPAMDDDDYRRGKLTNHKVYGQATAILAGDGLLTLAFETMLSQPGVSEKILLDVVREIARSAGPSGMVGGQVIDMLSEGKKIDIKTLESMHRKKTGALFSASVQSGAKLAGANRDELNALTNYANQFGLAFQITDDILDVIGDEKTIGKPVGSDEKNAKCTYVSIFGLDKARYMAQRAVEDAIDSLEIFGDKAFILRGLVEKLLTRTS